MKIIKRLLFAALVLCYTPVMACICGRYFFTIHNLEELNKYTFIAHVRIVASDNYPENTTMSHTHIGKLSFTILELFKGDSVSSLLEYDRYSSCTMGIRVGEEWILFGKMVDSSLAITACDRNVQYREIDGLRDWYGLNGIHIQRKLQVLYGHPQPVFESGVQKEYYANGQLEKSESYRNGKRHGASECWYPNGILRGRRYYDNDTIDGRSVWYYPSGQIMEERFYNHHKPQNVARIYYDSTIQLYKKHWLLQTYHTEDSLNFVYHRLQVESETVYDGSGQMVIYRHFFRLGKIKSEVLYPADGQTTHLQYHPNGMLADIEHYKNGKAFGRHQEYDENGHCTESVDYDENGREIRRE